MRGRRGGGDRRGKNAPDVVSITGAPTRHSDDLDKRITRYLVSMLIRTICVVLVVVVDSPVRWVFAAGAVLLPYVAVVFANARGDRHAPPPPVPPQAPRGAITPSRPPIHRDADGRSGQ